MLLITALKVSGSRGAYELKTSSEATLRDSSSTDGTGLTLAGAVCLKPLIETLIAEHVCTVSLNSMLHHIATYAAYKILVRLASEVIESDTHARVIICC